MSLTNLIQVAELQSNKKVFFISDLHLPLRISGNDVSTHREDKVLDWLDYIKPQAQALFLLGDVFEFWFEYKYLIPRGFLRFQIKLLEFYKEKIPVYFFVGNSDCWSIDYLMQECGVRIFQNPKSIHICNKSFFVGHGDTISATGSYRVIRKLYDNAFLQLITRTMPADWLYGIVYRFLKKKTYPFKNNSLFAEKDRIFQYCRDKIEPVMHHDFYIFGHTHVPFIGPLNNTSTYCNVGDWISDYTYSCFDGLRLSLLKF